MEFRKAHAALGEVLRLRDQIDNEKQDFETAATWELPQPDQDEVTVKLAETHSVDETASSYAQLDKSAAEEITALGPKLTDLAKAIGEAGRFANDSLQCLFIPAVDSGNVVKIQITPKKREAEAPAPKPDKTLASAGTDGVDGGSGPGTAKKGTGASKAKPITSSTGEVKLDTNTYEVLTPYHINVSLGFAVSGLANPTFDFRSEDVPAHMENGVQVAAQKRLTPYRKADQNFQVRPLVMLGLYPNPRYVFAQYDASDPYDSVHRIGLYVPYPAFGFSLTDPTKNFFTGGGWDLYPGISVHAGVHWGKVSRLLPAYKEEVSFLSPADKTVKIDDLTETSFHHSWFFSVGLEPRIIKKIFGGSTASAK